MKQNTENAVNTRCKYDSEVVYSLRINRVVGRQAVVGYAAIAWCHWHVHWCVGIAHRRWRKNALFIREPMSGWHRCCILVKANRRRRSVEHGKRVDEGCGIVREG